MKRRIAFLILLLATVGSIYAQTAKTPSEQQANKIYLVRHAERASDDKDSPLSVVGKKRADCLAAKLKDANIRTVLVTNFQRTKQTAAPIVSASHATQQVIDDNPQIVSAAREAVATGGVLIVGHSNTVPQILKALGGPTVPDATYDVLYVVDPAAPQSASTLHYCSELNQPSAPKM